MKQFIHFFKTQAVRLTALSLILFVMLSVSSAQNAFNINLQKLNPQAKTESIEDFETGGFTQFDWQTGGNQPWSTTDVNPYEGTYCARSGAINHSQTSFLSLTYDVYSAEDISFWYRVSSESGYDFLRFYIDNNEIGEWSGTVPWTLATYPVTAGNHTFKWEYSKDGSVVSGEDAVFVDYIVFPPMEIEALFEADTTVICETDIVQFTDMSVGPITQWNWIFEGGTPASSTDQNPVVGYFNAGSYDVMLIVSDGVESAELFMGSYITVGEVPVICPAATGITYLCASWGNSSYNTVGLTGITLYNWQVEPVEAGTVSGTGKNVTVVWAEDFLGTATLKVAGVNYCGIGTYSNPLTITRYLPNVNLPGYVAVSISTPPFALTGGTPTGGTYSGTGVTNGVFSPAVAGIGIHTITYTYTDPNLCENSAENTIQVTQFTDITGNTFSTGINIQPNPNNGNFNLVINLQEVTTVNLKVYSSLNEVVYELNDIVTDQKLTRNIDLSNYSAGIYYVHLTSPTNQWVNKVIITK